MQIFRTIGCKVKICQRGPKMQKCKEGRGGEGEEDAFLSPKPQIVETCRLEQWFLTSLRSVIAV